MPFNIPIKRSIQAAKKRKAQLKVPPLISTTEVDEAIDVLKYDFENLSSTAKTPEPSKQPNRPPLTQG